jgi:DNA-binding LacI/PurR family transcriptional regulator
MELGTLAAGHAVELIENPDAEAPETILPVELVVRASSSPG